MGNPRPGGIRAGVSWGPLGLPGGARTEPGFASQSRYKTMHSRLMALLVLPALLVTTGAARADYTFIFTDSSGTVSGNFTVAQGATIDIRVYLSQSGADTGLSSSGLVNAGVK